MIIVATLLAYVLLSVLRIYDFSSRIMEGRIEVPVLYLVPIIWLIALVLSLSNLVSFVQTGAFWSSSDIVAYLAVILLADIMIHYFTDTDEPTSIQHLVGRLRS